MSRLTRTWVSPRSWVPVPRSAAKEARSASTASSCPIADRSPSSIPISTSCCIASRLGKWVTLVKRDPVAVGSKVNIIRMLGMLSSGRPSSSAKPSSTSIRRPGSTARKRHQPRDVLPSGPVMW